MQQSYLGQLVVANPRNPPDNLGHSVILIVSDSHQVSLGLQINRVLDDFTLRDVGDQMGLYIDIDQPVFAGGNMTPNKIHIIHTNDWAGLTTVRLNSEISITNDVSVLAALSRNSGPRYFKACAGFWGWESGQLGRQILAKNTDLIRHRWEVAPSSIETVFSHESHIDQWQQVLQVATRQQVDAWL